MWLINKSYLLESEASSESPHCNSIAEIRVYKYDMVQSEVEGYEKWYISIYMSIYKYIYIYMGINKYI